MDAPQKKFVFFLILAVVVGMLAGGKLLPLATSNQLSVVSDQKILQKLKIGKAEIKVEVADTDEARSRGLAGRDSLAEDEGMVFIFEQPGQYGFWMKGMKLPLDFVWIADNKVVEITEDIPVDVNESPKVYQPQPAIDAMLEVNAGWAGRNGVKVGDRVVVEW
ncbi:MAG: hypothetical protein A2784_04985 [Candidatus Chisholmbacteria bacterium RIFCSPHIGHO2_01_FULL_48_12]|uniref:DUF192 domain-containing protein n=1 Tax=Candidatus Chisholmbacteria bacterium RIFCSPHIGHO2_01_FULL_48_12 TaxID=1797589 RepID=A0A1G1VS58_9BACT|nr:MAG: hypothetical protein A2784_04985 [Candidatus Chisholmbacteria bacterium RIFCSPHIGHO2_01_FULL_48_12]